MKLSLLINLKNFTLNGFNGGNSQSVSSSNEAQDISNVNVPQGNLVESRDISITEVNLVQPWLIVRKVI